MSNLLNKISDKLHGNDDKEESNSSMSYNTSSNKNLDRDDYESGQSYGFNDSNNYDTNARSHEGYGQGGSNTMPSKHGDTYYNPNERTNDFSETRGMSGTTNLDTDDWGEDVEADVIDSKRCNKGSGAFPSYNSGNMNQNDEY